MTTPAETRPVVALDFDGVLNPLGDDRDLAPGYTDHKLHVPAKDVPNSWFVRGGGEKPLDVTVRIHADHGPWIRSLLEVADVVWATTWEQAANLYLAPLLGIDPLPLGVSTEKHPPRFGYVKSGDAGAWKSEALQTEFARRPLVWADDMNNSWIRQSEEVQQTLHIVTSRDDRFLEAARRHRWDNHRDWAPARHFEDTWAEGQWLPRHSWSAVAYGGSVRGFEDRVIDPEDGEYDLSYVEDTAPTMTVNTAPEVGLTPEHMEAITRFVHEHASA